MMPSRNARKGGREVSERVDMSDLPVSSGVKESGNSPDDYRANEIRKPHRNHCPNLDQSFEFFVLRSHFRQGAIPEVVLPDRGYLDSPPLFLEAVSIAPRARSAEIEEILASFHGAHKELPVEKHIGVGVVMPSQGAGTGDLGDPLSVEQECGGASPPVFLDHANL